MKVEQIGIIELFLCLIFFLLLSVLVFGNWVEEILLCSR